MRRRAGLRYGDRLGYYPSLRWGKTVAGESVLSDAIVTDDICREGLLIDDTDGAVVCLMRRRELVQSRGDRCDDKEREKEERSQIFQHLKDYFLSLLRCSL